eukprot:GHRQ01037752.1.p1 GENE.GHRQ01037752.1~~GHRQ01037752.1.p1  ORF type:complete len:203 (+),score=83.91 GHRQ01037752.1:319-927(+)
MARDKKTAQRKSAATSTSAAASGKAEPKKSKKANQGSYDSLREPLDRELALLGLRVKQITADGNCFFRALSDQLEGNEHQHSALRARVVGLMQAHEDDYAPFVEDDQSWQAYTSRMKKEGTWAGHIELQAASLLLQANIAVYQAGQPRWSITNFPAGEAASSQHCSAALEHGEFPLQLTQCFSFIIIVAAALLLYRAYVHYK